MAQTTCKLQQTRKSDPVFFRVCASEFLWQVKAPSQSLVPCFLPERSRCFDVLSRVPWNWKWKASTVSKLANTLQCLRQTLAYYGHIAFHVWSLPPLSCRREPHGCCFCSFARSSSQLSVAVDLLKIVITQGNKGGSTDHKWGYPWITHFNRISTINHPAIGDSLWKPYVNRSQDYCQDCQDCQVSVTVEATTAPPSNLSCKTIKSVENDLLNLLMTWPVLWPLWRPAKDRYLEDFEIDLFFFTASRLIRPPCNDANDANDANDMHRIWLECDLMTWWLDDSNMTQVTQLTQVTKHHEALNWNSPGRRGEHHLCITASYRITPPSLLSDVVATPGRLWQP